MKKRMYYTMAVAMLMGIGTFMMNATNVHAGMLEGATKSAKTGWLEEAARGSSCDDDTYDDVYDSDTVELSIAGKRMQIPSSINELNI